MGIYIIAHIHTIAIGFTFFSNNGGFIGEERNVLSFFLDFHLPDCNNTIIRSHADRCKHSAYAGISPPATAGK